MVVIFASQTRKTKRNLNCKCVQWPLGGFVLLSLSICILLFAKKALMTSLCVIGQSYGFDLDKYNILNIEVV